MSKTNIVGNMGTFKDGINNSPIGQTTPAAGKFTTIDGDSLDVPTGRCATLIVAANDSSALSKQQADYVCDGVADDVQIQAAIDALPTNGGKVVVLEGTVHISSPILPTNYIHLEFLRTVLEPTGNNILINFDATLYSKVHGFILNCNYAGHSEPLVKMNGTSNQLLDFIINCDTQTDGSPIIQLISAAWFNKIDNVSFIIGDNAPTLLQLNQNTTSGIQGNTFNNFNKYAGGVCCEFIPYGNTWTSLNAFSDWQLEASMTVATKTTQGIKDIDGNNNVFNSINIFDFATDGSYTGFNTKTTAEDTTIMGGTLGYSYEDFGNNSTIHDWYSHKMDSAITNLTSLSGDSVINGGNFETLDDVSKWSLVRSTLALSDEQVKTGYLSGKIIASSDINGGMLQDVSGYVGYKGKVITVGAWVYALSINSTTQSINLNFGASEIHTTITKNDAWQWVTLTAKVPQDATRIRLLFYAGSTPSNSDVLYVAGARIIHGTNCPSFLVGAAAQSIRHSNMFMDVLAVSATYIRSNEDLSAATPITFTIDAQPDVPRTLSWSFDTHTQITEYDMEVIGINAKGNSVTETWDESAGWSGETSNAFATITSIKMTSRTGTGVGDTMDIGITDVLGLSNIIYETSDVFKIKKNNANATVATAQVNTTYDTYDMSVITLGAGDNLTIWYKSNLNIIS